MGDVGFRTFPLRFLTVTPDQSRDSNLRLTKAARVNNGLRSAPAMPMAPARPRAPNRKCRSHVRRGVPDVRGLTARAGLCGSPLLRSGSSLAVIAGPRSCCLHCRCLLPLVTRVRQAPNTALATLVHLSGEVRAHCFCRLLGLTGLPRGVGPWGPPCFVETSSREHPGPSP